MWSGVKNLIMDKRGNTAFILVGKRRKEEEKGGREEGGRTNGRLRPNSPGSGLRGLLTPCERCASVSGSLGGWASSNAFSLLLGGKWCV